MQAILQEALPGSVTGGKLRACSQGLVFEGKHSAARATTTMVLLIACTGVQMVRLWVTLNRWVRDVGEVLTVWVRPVEFFKITYSENGRFDLSIFGLAEFQDLKGILPSYFSITYWLERRELEWKMTEEGLDAKRLLDIYRLFNHNGIMVLFVGSLAELSDKQGWVWPSFSPRRVDLSIICGGC